MLAGQKRGTRDARETLRGGQKPASRSQGWGCQGRADPPWSSPLAAAASGRAVLHQWPESFRHHVSTRASCLTLGLLAAGWRPAPLRLVFAAGGPWSLLPRPCRVLVLLNPRGGKGKALQLFRSHVQPLLAQADVSFTLMLTGECLPERVQGASTAGEPLPPTQPLRLPTERRNHARELVQSEELGRWDALVVMSGDGVMHEVRPAQEAGSGGGVGAGCPWAEATRASAGGEWTHGAAGLGDRHPEAAVQPARGLRERAGGLSEPLRRVRTGARAGLSFPSRPPLCWVLLPIPIFWGTSGPPFPELPPLVLGPVSGDTSWLPPTAPSFFHSCGLPRQPGSPCLPPLPGRRKGRMYDDPFSPAATNR